MIKTPDSKTAISQEEAIKQYENDKKILLELSDGAGIYAAYVFSKEFGRQSFNVASKREIEAYGTWYLLEGEQA